MNLSLARLATLTLAGVFLNAAFPHATSAAGVLAAGEGSAAAITASGRLATWGANDAGQLGHSPGEKVVPLPGSVGGVSSWTKVAAGGRFTLGLGGDGRLYAWGDNSSGQLGSGSAVDATATPVPVALPTGAVVRDFVAGQSHALALVDLPGGDTGALYSWGGNFFGQLGLAVGDFSTRSTPARVTAGGLRFRQIAATYVSSFAIAQDGSLWAWGSNSRGELGQGKRITAANLRSSVPVRVGKALNWTSLAGGSFHVLALGGGRVYAWGANDFGQCAGSGKGQVLAPAALTLTRAKGQPAFTVTALSAGNTHSLALVSSGHVYAWGLNQSGKLGRAPAASGRNVTATPTIIDQDDPASADPRRRIALPAATAIAAGGDFTLLALASGDYLAFGSNLQGQLGIGSTDTTSVGSGASRAPLLNVANLAVSAPGPVSANVVGTVPQFGVGGTFGPFSLPVRNAGFVAHATGYRVSLYLSRDASLDASDRLLAEAVEPAAAFAAGEVRATVFSASALAVPDVSAGSYFLLSQVVPLNASGAAIADAFAPDNGASTAVGVVGPDLGIFGAIALERTVVGPGDAGFGDVSVTLTNANHGLVPAGRPILVEAYLSTDDVLQPSTDLLLKSIQVTPGAGGLPGGATLLAGFGSVSLPASVDGGDYSLFVVVNRDGSIAESGASANSIRLPVRVASHDLAVSAPVLPAGPLGSAAELGDIPINVQNLGARSYSSSMTVELLVSTKTTFDFTAVKLGSQILTGGLSAGASVTAIIPAVTLPITLRGPVTFFSRVSADPAFGDRFPANNIASVSANLGQASPAISDILFPATNSVEAGGSLGAVTFRLGNTGPGSLPAGYPVSVEVYLSADQILDRSGDIRLDRYSYSEGLSAGQSVNLPGSARNLTIPAGTPNGFYYLIIAVNADGGQADLPSVATTALVNVGALALSVTAPEVATTALGANGTVPSVSFGINNRSGFSVPAGLGVELYLSKDAIFDNGDLPLASATLANAIAGNTLRAIDFKDVLLPDLSQGSYYLFSRIVLPAGVLDTDPADNVAATEVTLSRAQLAIEGFRPPVDLDLEQPSPALQRLSFTLVNLSPGVIPADKTLSYEIFLSRDDDYDQRDTLLYAGRFTGGLAGLGRVTTPNFDLSIDPNLVGGTYKLLLIVNRDGAATLGSAEPVITRADVMFQKQNAPERGLDYGVFTLSQPQSWTTVADSRATGASAFQSAPLAKGQNATLRLQVTGPTEIRAPWKLSPGVGDRVSYRIDGDEKSSLATFDPVYKLPGSGGTPIGIPAGQHSLDFVYEQNSNDQTAYARVDLDVPTFSSSGGGYWYAVEGVDAKVNGNYTRSPQLAAGEQVSLSVQVQGPALVAFWWRVTGDASDTLEFAIDGKTALLPTKTFDETADVARISNQPDWRRVAFLIEGGPRTLTWTYKQNSANVSSQGNIDGLVVLNPVPEVFSPNNGTDPVEYSDVPSSTLDYGIRSATTPVIYDTSGAALPAIYLLDDANGTARLPVRVNSANIGKAFVADPVWSASNLQVRLSTDQNWGNGDDITLGNFARFQALKVGAEIVFDADLNLPLDLPAGVYYLIVRVRAFDQGDEFTLANNTLVVGQVVIRRAPNLVIRNFSGLERYFPYHPEDAVYVTYDIANTGLGDVLPTDRFKARLSLLAISPTATDITTGTVVKRFLDREFSVFLPAPSASYPDVSSVPVTHFLDLPSERDLLAALGIVEADTPEDDASVAANRSKLRNFLFYFNVVVDVDKQVAESSETNTFWFNQLFNVTPVPYAENAGSFYGDAAFGPFLGNNSGSFTNAFFDVNALPPMAGTFTDFIWDYALFRAPAGTPNLLFQDVVQNGSELFTVPSYGSTRFNTLTFDFNIRASDLEIVVEAGDDTKGWGSVITLTPPYNQSFGSRSLSGYGGLSSSPYVTAIEGNATDVQKTYAARITVRDNLPLSQRGPNPGMRLKVRPAAGIYVATPSNLTGSQVDSTIVLNWSGSLPSNSFGTQGAWIVERSRSLNGQFESIGSTTSNTFTDNYPGSKGTNTYRIRGLTSAGASATVQTDVTLR